MNGGAPYLIRDGAYPGIDGSFQPEFTFTEQEAYDRCRVVADLHQGEHIRRAAFRCRLLQFSLRCSMICGIALTDLVAERVQIHPHPEAPKPACGLRSAGFGENLPPKEPAGK